MLILFFSSLEEGKMEFSGKQLLFGVLLAEISFYFLQEQKGLTHK